MMGLDARFANKLSRLFAMLKFEGIEATMTSGRRTNERQGELYDLYRQGKGPRAALPGRSCHEYGAAADIMVLRIEYHDRQKWDRANQLAVEFAQGLGLTASRYDDSKHIHIEDTALCRELRGDALPAKPQFPSPAGGSRSRVSDPPLTPAGSKGCP